MRFRFISQLFNESGTTKNHHSGNKGQAAMEFLMTYGWAILVVIIAISALYYFGIFGKGPSVSSCILSPGLACKDLQVTTTGIYLVVQNSLGIDITSVTIDIKSADITFTPLTIPSSLRDDETKQVFIETVPGNNIDLRKKFKGDILVSYKKSGSVLSNMNQGILTGQAESTGPVQGMVGYWKFDENSGTIPADSSSSGNNGALNDASAWIVGKYGSALDFGTSAGKYVSIADSNSIDIGTSDFTVAAYVKTSSTAGGAIISKTDLGTSPGYYFGITSNWRQIYFEVRDSASFVNGANDVSLPLNDGNWHHVAIVFKRGGNPEFYFDGAVQTIAATLTIPTGDFSNNRPLFIGESEGGVNHFNGVIDEVRIYNRALSAAEIALIA